MRNRDQRRSPLPARLTPAERDFCEELRRLVDAAGLSPQTLEEATSRASSDASEPNFYSRSQWERWLDGESLPPRTAIRKLTERLAKEEIGAGHLVDLWARAFKPSWSPQEPGGVLPRPQQLPIATRYFTGRGTELDTLDRLVDQATGSGRAVVAVIGGTAGVGKTALAIHLGHQVADRFPDGQLYVNMRGFGGNEADLGRADGVRAGGGTDADGAAGRPMTAAEALRGFLDAFGISPKSIPVTLDDQAALYRSLLAGRRVLVVVDNARDAAEVRPLLPGSPGCLTLVTTRDQLTGLADEGAHVLRLEPLTRNEGRDLLLHRLGADRVENEPEAAEELAELCSRLPLALSVAAAHAAAHPEFPLAVFCSEFRSRRDSVDAADPAATTRTVFSWSYHHLSDRSARMFRLLGIHPGPDVSVPAAASLAAVPADAARKALDELTHAHLLEEHVPGRFTFHDLIRAYAAEQARAAGSDEELAAAERRLLDHYLRTAQAGMLLMYPARHRIKLPPVRGVTPETFVAYEQAQAWFQAEHHVLMTAVTHAGGRGLDEYCWRLAWTVGSQLNRRGLLHDYAASQRIALDAAQRLNDLEGLGHVHYELAHACARLGEIEESDAHLRESLLLFTRLGDQVSVAEVQHGLAGLLDQQGRYAEALTHARESLRLRRSFGDRAKLAYSENAVGWLCAQLGQYEDALRHCRRAVELHRESGSRSGAADALDSIGFACRGLGDYEQAISHYQRALAIYRDIRDPTGQATSLTGLGDAQLAAGQPAAARQSWQQALEAAGNVPSADTQPIEARLAVLADPGGTAPRNPP